MHFSGARNSQWDGIYEPFEPEMDYSEIGIKLRDDDIPVLHEKLAAVGDEEYARKQVPCPLQGCLEGPPGFYPNSTDSIICAGCVEMCRAPPTLWEYGGRSDRRIRQQELTSSGSKPDTDVQFSRGIKAAVAFLLPQTSLLWPEEQPRDQWSICTNSLGAIWQSSIWLIIQPVEAGSSFMQVDSDFKKFMA
eukprot:1020628-Pelagomonas_calceolata.AAC.1